ncbi:MAG: LacI family transcriptional regulator, partial [Neobacillus sp.]|nr:LacI family transcriptional regulator [Neobacillus sp.]
MGNKYKKITMQDIADKLEISKNAVSIALSNKPGVSEALRQHIFEIAAEMGYKDLNKNDAEITKRKLLLIIPEYIADDKFFYYDIFQVIEREALENEYAFQVYRLSKEEEDLLILPDEVSQTNAVILVGVVQAAYARKLKNSVEGVVFLDNYYDDVEANYILTDNINGTYKAVLYLKELGHTNIGFIGARDNTSSLYDRWLGFQKGMNNCGFIVNPEHCITPDSKLNTLLTGMDELRPYIENLQSMPTAWISGNDRVAYALINLLRENGYKVPEDISVIGFDDMEFSKLFSPPLT